MTFIFTQLETVDDDAVEIVETEMIVEVEAKKRKTESTENELMAKKRKVDVNNGHGEKDVYTIDSGDSDDEPQNDVTMEKIISKKHKTSSDDECSIIYDDTNNMSSPKKAKTAN